MTWYLLISLVCACLLTGSDACCVPDKVTADYVFNIDAKIPMGGPGGPLTSLPATLNGKFTIDFPNDDMYEEATGHVVIPIPTGDGKTMDYNATVSYQLGIINGEKIWVKGDAGMMGNVCYYVEVDGGIPDNYQCVLDFFQKTGGDSKEYTAPHPSPMFKESVVVDDSCQPLSQQVDVMVPRTVEIHLKATMTNHQQTVDASLLAKNILPAGCQKRQTIKLPKLQKNGLAGLASFASLMGGQPQKRNFPTEHRQVMAELTKRSFEEISRRAIEKQRERREAQKSMDKVSRQVRSLFKELF